MEDIEKANEQLREKDQELLLKTEEFTSKLSQKEDLLQKLTYEKEILLKRTSPFDFTRLFSIIIELETRILPLLTPILEDQNLSEAVTFRIKSLEQELLTLFSFFKDLQNNPLTDKNKDNRRLSNENTKESPLKDSSRIDAYWKSVVMALTFEKEHLLKRFENPNTESLYNRIKELEESLQEKNNQTQDQNSNENYWKSLISSLSDEKEQLLKKLETLGNKNSQYVLESLKIQVRELEDVLHEKNSQIMSFNELIQEWQLKYSQIEEEIHENGLEALTKEDTLEREIVSLKEQLFLNEKLLGSREAEILDYCQTLSQRTEKQKALETENRKLIIELNEAKLKLSRIDKDYEETQNLVKSLKEELALIQKNKDLSSIHEQQLLELSSKFEDFRTKSFEKIEALSQELEHTESMRNDLLKGYEEKSQENNELMEMLKELELLTESQGKTLSLKETQINNIENKMKLLENEKNICEKKMNELQELKMRNKRCLETITGSSNEINGLKKEMEALMNSQKVLQEKLFEKESLIIELNHLIKGSKAQTEKNIKALDEKEHLINELRRSKGQNEGNSKGLFEKEGIILEQSQQIKLLKGLLDKNHEELEGVKRERDNVSIEYQKLIERNEKMMMDSDKFLTIEMLNKEKNVEDIEERTAFLDVTNMQMMKSMKDQVEKKEKMIASFRPPKKIIEERDLEIKRLSKIVIFLKF